MADESTNKTISSTDSGFPSYLNFDTLRSDAIAYLGNLSGKIWTDYNVHDPGITILEALIYAVLDLGYRTNLPIVDLLTRKPGDESKDNNFFTASQILTNNPLTITDFRKLLIDIKGVKNAWLEIEDQLPADFCKTNNNNFNESFINLQEDVCKCDSLNGLYHVFIELEMDYDSNTASDTQTQEYNEIIYNIKCALMSHRNLCEDFIDIKILCKLKTGMCADIELQPDANAEDVYLKILETLRDFFSPAPKFYTLPQLLEKEKPIEEIFAGRPYNVTESYGFVDTDELEALTLRKKIHLSDVYHVLFGIEGIKNIRNLAWNVCSNVSSVPDTTNPWILQLPENFIPEFEPGCSGFKFFKFGMPVNPDTSKVNSLFELNFSANGKILYKQPSPYLDTEIPGGVYRSDLADYYSIQNDFPHVYGIKAGDLSDTASDRRKAQALQLQGFLLFFDQLLADYLSQLKNIRSLFAFSSSENEIENHTYFTNTLTDVPQLDKLLRFSNSSNDGILGTQGSILAYPTNRKNLEDLIASGKIKNTDLDRRCNDVNKDDFPPYQFCYAVTMEEAENQLRDDLLNGDFNPVVLSNYNDCWFFYCFTTSNDFALISKKYYSSEKEAKTAAASIKYLGTFAENFRSFTITDITNQFFSFDIELNLNSYAEYLQLICEDENLYRSRRQDFLNHLLSRFAEQFTDFALLNSGLLSPTDLQKAQIKAEEKFLTHYDGLSSNRGKGYDYKCDGWGNENTSGFEKRFKALCGIENWKKHYLCNFVVEPADEIYQLSISLFGSAFSVEDKKVTYEAGYSSLQSLYKKLADNPSFDSEFLAHEQKWSVFIKDDFGNKYSDQNLFDTKEEADSYINSLQSTLSEKQDFVSNVFVSQYIFKILFNDFNSQPIEESVAKYNTPEDAKNHFTEITSDANRFLNDANEFLTLENVQKPGELLLLNNNSDDALYIDKSKFEFKPVDVILLENVKKKFVLLDDKKTIQFDSLIEYDTEVLAESGFEQLLNLLTISGNYFVDNGNVANEFKILIKNADAPVAVYYQTFPSSEEAANKIKEINNEINSQTYHLKISSPIPDSWEFKFHLNDPSSNGVEFVTSANFKTESDALSAVKQFYNNAASLQINKVKNDLQLSLNGDKTIIAHNTLPADDSKGAADNAKQLLQYHRTFLNAINDPQKAILTNLEAGKDSAAQQYVYKLVDKDNLLAKSSFESNDLQSALNKKNDLINAIQSGYNYTTIYFGNDAIDERKDAVTNTTWYHFVIKCTNVFYQKGDAKGQPLVLFESTKGYISKDEAMQAFLNNYLIILRTAFTDSNYGINKPISLTEIFIHETDSCNESMSEVFIPAETIYEYDGNTADVINAEIVFARSYPVFYIRNGCYRFTLFNTGAGMYDWRGMKWYASPQIAMQQFLFFLSLLNYPGNIYIEKNPVDCRYRIYIREVLAISAIMFPTAETAWGANGIEKFICIAQTENGFHNYLNRKNCSNSFYVACANTGLIHPCKYETPERRDTILNKLFQSASFNFLDLIETNQENQLSLLGLDKKPIANLLFQTNDGNQFSNCERLIEIFEAVYFDSNYVQIENNFYLVDDNKNRIAEPVLNDTLLDDWKKQLREIACFFPVKRKPADAVKSSLNQSQCNFYIQIKLPGFNSCSDDLANNCPDINNDNDCRPGCYVAWKSDCCFQSCCDALRFYSNVLIQLHEFSNYKPVYECNCGNFGIELHADQLPLFYRKKETLSVSPIGQMLCGNDQYSNENGNYVDQKRYFNPCQNEIVAINPQKYENASLTCEAVERAKKLINSEGLHLVEHILLRPRCQNADGVYEDCDCAYLPKPCVQFENTDNPENVCHFQWIPGGDQDPCATNKITCFTPGCDPYSFIATIALPAWPQRFRSKENRAIIEKRLQTEAPAHVLLRILWLAPRDFCCFEYDFKNWNYWLAKKMCDPNYNNCDFLGLLFHKNFEDLNECNECVPCACNEVPAVSCFENIQEPCADFNLTNQLNNLYCWNSNNYDSYPCENIDTTQVPIPAPAAVAGKLPAQSEIATMKTPIKAEDTQPAPATMNLGVIDDREKNLILQARSYRYKENIKKIADAKPGNKTAENALRFLSGTHPDAKRYDDLINKILKNKPEKSKNIKGLTLKEKNILIDNVSWQYFDRVCLNEKNTDKITMQNALFNHLRKNKIDMRLLYDDWNSKELKTIEPGINFNKIKTVVI